MKQSWIIGVITIYFVILMAELMATNGSAFDPNISSNLTVLSDPTMVNSSNAFTATSSIVNNVGDYFLTFINAILLRSPTIFTGYWQYFYMFVCLPISISFIVCIVMILRGVKAS